MRSDALKNHEKIVATASDVFKERGMDASLDEIATRAGVGPGTLYRHFPTREDLIDAVVRSWMEQIDAAANDAVTSDAPARQVLLTWFSTYVARISRNKGGPAKLTCAMGKTDSPMFSKCEALRLANQRVLDRFQRDGAVRSNVDGLEVCRLVGGVAIIADQSDLDESSITPMLEVVIDGLLVT